MAHGFGLGEDGTVKQGWIIGVFILVVLGACGFYVFKRNQEPVYQGKRLNEWLNAYGAWRMQVADFHVLQDFAVNHTGEPSRIGTLLDRMVIDPVPTKGWQGELEVQGAIRAIGTDGVPWMLRWMVHKRPKWEVWLFNRLAPLFTSKRTRKIQNYLSPDYEAQINYAGIHGFLLLGPNARGAVPELRNLLNATTNVQLHDRSKFCLWLARPPSQILIHRLNYRDEYVVEAAARELGRRGKEERALVIPPLVECWRTNAHASARAAAAESLARFGTNAAAAVPMLKLGLTDTNDLVRETASKALELIEPGFRR